MAPKAGSSGRRRSHTVPCRHHVYQASEGLDSPSLRVGADRNSNSPDDHWSQPYPASYRIPSLVTDSKSEPAKTVNIYQYTFNQPNNSSDQSNSINISNNRIIGNQDKVLSDLGEMQGRRYPDPSTRHETRPIQSPTDSPVLPITAQERIDTDHSRSINEMLMRVIDNYVRTPLRRIFNKFIPRLAQDPVAVRLDELETGVLSSSSGANTSL